MSNREAEAARIGYRRREVLAAASAAGTTARRGPRRPDDVADELLDSLLDPDQRRDRRRHGRFWVHVDRGWLQMGGSPHDIRFRPEGRPGVEISLCVVAADRSLPKADVWATLLLTATGAPDTFFRVANRSAPPGPTRQPRNPPPLR